MNQHRNAGKAWGAYEDDTMRRMTAEGHDFRAIAEALGRTRFGVEQRLIKLGLSKTVPRFSDRQITEWAERHGIDNSPLSTLRMAFDDARSLVPMGEPLSGNAGVSGPGGQTFSRPDADGGKDGLA